MILKFTYLKEKKKKKKKLWSLKTAHAEIEVH
jgi:hypothetical protein